MLHENDSAVPWPSWKQDLWKWLGVGCLPFCLSPHLLRTGAVRSSPGREALCPAKCLPSSQEQSKGWWQALLALEGNAMQSRMAWNAWCEDPHVHAVLIWGCQTSCSLAVCTEAAHWQSEPVWSIWLQAEQSSLHSIDHGIVQQSQGRGTTGRFTLKMTPKPSQPTATGSPTSPRDRRKECQLLAFWKAYLF